MSWEIPAFYARPADRYVGPVLHNSFYFGVYFWYYYFVNSV